MTEPLSLAKYPYVHGNPVNAIDPTGLFIIATLTDLLRVAEHYAKQAAPIVIEFATIVAKIVIPIATVLAGTYILLREIPERLGIPFVVYGNDLEQTRDHIFKALTFQGYTKKNPDGTIFLSERISPVLTRLRKEDDPNRRGWYNDEKQCKGKTGYDLPTQMVCDEYPYASTKEGGKANYAKNVVSIYPVIATEQTKGSKTQGVLLNKFYSKNFGNVPKGDSFGNFGEFTPRSYWIDKNGKGPFYFWQ